MARARDSFSSCHPLVNFSFFAAVLLFSMLFMHPVLQAIGLAGAAIYAWLLRGRQAAKFQLAFMLPMLLIMVAMNPLFNHAGVTILFYLKSGNPITLESIRYGIAAAFMFITVLIWFTCYNAVMASDKFIYLFGRLIPALSLVLSMALRFVPRYIEQVRVIAHAQRCIGRDVTQGSVLARARNGLAILSILVTWALENAIETANSMKARGYGLPGRTSFSLYRFDRRDWIVSGAMLVLILVIAAGAAAGSNTMRFYPSIRIPELTAIGVASYVAYGLLCLLPTILYTMEGWKWKAIASRR